MKKLIPNMYYKSIYDIDYDYLKKKKIKCILFDLDNTCLPYPNKVPTKELRDLFNRLKEMDFNVILFSNTISKRLVNFNDLNIEVYSMVKKPNTKNFFKILKKYFYQKKEVCIIGDQLFTDILGGNKTGIITILVDPLSKNDFIFTKCTRLLEQIYFNIFKKKGILIKGEYYSDK